MNNDLSTLIRSSTSAFGRVLPSHLNPEAFAAAAETAVLTTPGLQDCDRDSVIMACMRAAQDGLLLDGKQAVLVIGSSRRDGRWMKTAQYWSMALGLQLKAYRSGKVLRLESRLVYANDVFSLAYGTAPQIEHVPSMKERGPFIGAYAIATLKSGLAYVEWMSRAEIEGIMKRSKSWDEASQTAKGPWASDFGEMARKSVLRRALKYLPFESAPQDEDPGEADSPETELVEGPWKPFHEHREGRVTLTSGESAREADRPLEEPAGVADAEMLAEPAEAASEVATKRDLPAEEVSTWKAHLRELRDQIAKAQDKDEVEEVYTSWDANLDEAPSEVTAAAKRLVDERLYAVAHGHH